MTARQLTKQGRSMTARQLTKQELDALRTDMQAASVLMKVGVVSENGKNRTLSRLQRP